MHIYDYTDKDNPFLSDETSIKAIRDNDNYYPSVTTILKVIPNHFLDKWKCAKYVELARIHFDADAEKISELAWGQVTTPYGDTVSSSEFGTKAHEALELYFDDIEGDKKWRDFVSQAYENIISQEIVPQKTEFLVSDNELRVAGSVDLLAKQNDMYVLLDYKFRKCKDRGKFYDSDCYQLSIESFFVQQLYNLSYIPKVCSVCIDNSSGVPYFKWWSKKKVDKGIQVFLDARDLYFTLNNIN
jgi:hypothetical protein